MTEGGQCSPCWGWGQWGESDGLDQLSHREVVTSRRLHKADTWIDLTEGQGGLETVKGDCALLRVRESLSY